MNTKDAFHSMEEQYTPEYCSQLEQAYGSGMMSEGGIEGIEHMFHGVPLEKKSALDIGSGLGGVAFYLAEKYRMNITGLEVNSWMIKQSKRRTPPHLKNKVTFILTKSNSYWPLREGSLDLIYSKGVLTHVERKGQIFLECHRLLKDEGLLVITDWLSSKEKVWGRNIARLIKLEKLILYPESETDYIEALQKNGFSILSVRDDSLIYKKYNQDIVEKLQALMIQSDDSALENSLKGYQSIVKAIEEGELKILRFIAQKK